jgi:hypothetical protein
MNRYHKAVYTTADHWQTLKKETDYFNTIKWQYTGHCLENLINRAVDIEGILRYIKDLKLNTDDIFEYYLWDNGTPEKICYRIKNPAGLDIILVIGEEKNIITIYLNSPDDDHITLKKELYKTS